MDVQTMVDGLNRATSVGGTALAYDSRGNLTDAGAGQTYGYDAAGRLVSGAGGLAFKYDAAGRLYETAKTGSATTRLLYDGADLVAEYDTAGTVLRRYVHGPGADEPLVWYEGSGTSSRRFLVADERGSVVAVTSVQGGLLAANRYDEYGRPGANNLGRFQYTGQQWIAEAGLYYYKARFYHPGLGRFLQPDPIGYAAGLNLYAYVGGDPVNRIDPSGLQDVCWDVTYTTGYSDLDGWGSKSYTKTNCTWVPDGPPPFFSPPAPRNPGGPGGAPGGPGDNGDGGGPNHGGEEEAGDDNKGIDFHIFKACPVVEAEVSIGAQIGAGFEGVGPMLFSSLGGRLDLTSIRAVASTRGGAVDVTHGVSGHLGILGIIVGGEFGRQGPLIPSTAPNMTPIQEQRLEGSLDPVFAGVGGYLAVLGGVGFEAGFDLVGINEPCPTN